MLIFTAASSRMIRFQYSTSITWKPPWLTAIIANRFSQSASVSLREIETYYAEIYAPAQKKLGRDPRPLMDVLDTLESEIREAKISVQVGEWIRNLRKQAEIALRDGCLKNY